MATRKKIPLIDASASLAVTGTVTITGSGSAVITFPSTTSTLATTTGTQELTNKTIVAGNNTISGIANANLSTTAGDIGGAWKAWTPTLSGLFDNAKWNKSCYYTQIGKTVHCRIKLTANNTTPLSGSGNAHIALPVAAITTTGYDNAYLGPVRVTDVGTAAFSGQFKLADANNIYITVHTASGSYTQESGLTPSIPMTWTTADYFAGTFTYEAA